MVKVAKSMIKPQLKWEVWRMEDEVSFTGLLKAPQLADPVEQLPILIKAPHFLSDGASILGLGDIILPGLCISFLYRFDPNPWSGYFVNALVGKSLSITNNLPSALD